ncbi:YfbU family protein [Superficieibacter sp.]|uniref:YfbU family protein n=1 Tax=Superficieibacter sp. TaxID=2303322 RepID=UPI0028B0525C|nr:YfbU family protein [Superficieibacter sp.]
MDTKDKISTVLLCDIAMHLGIDTDFDPEIVKYALTSGQDWVLDAKYAGYFSEGSSKAQRDFVVELLNAYRGLSKSYRLLGSTEQQELKKTHRLRIHDGYIQLPGFDGNNEYTYISIIEAFQKIERFPEQKSPINNTHSQTEHHYNALIEACKKANAVNREWELGAEEVSEILSHAPLAL